jgi:hypothetical protein
MNRSKIVDIFVQGMRSSRLPLLCVLLYFTVFDSPMLCVASLSFYSIGSPPWRTTHAFTSTCQHSNGVRDK